MIVKTTQKFNPCRPSYFKLTILLLMLILTKAEAAPESSPASTPASNNDSQHQSSVQLATTLSKNIKNCTPGSYPILSPSSAVMFPTETSHQVKYREITYLISGYNNGKCNVSITSGSGETKHIQNCKYSQGTLDYIADSYLKMIVDYNPLEEPAAADEKSLNLLTQMIRECTAVPSPQAGSH